MEHDDRRPSTTSSRCGRGGRGSSSCTTSDDHSGEDTHLHGPQHLQRQPQPQPNPQHSFARSASPPPRSRRRQVCLFGLSADPPTGAGGHLSIVQALRELRHQHRTGSSDLDYYDEDEVEPTKEAGPTSDAPVPESQTALTATNGNLESSNHDDRSSMIPYAFDEVWVLPVYRHTFQEKQTRLADFQHRLRMCELAFLDPSLSSSTVSSTGAGERRQGRPLVVVSDAELRSWEAAVERAEAQCRRNGSPFDPTKIAVGTASLLDYLQTVHPDLDFHFCLGADSFWDLVKGKWKESERVLAGFRGRLWVVQRSGLSNVEADRSVESAGVGARVLRVADASSISSTRARGCRDVEEMSRLVPDPVLQYMKSNALYAFAASGVL